MCSMRAVHKPAVIVLAAVLGAWYVCGEGLRYSMTSSRRGTVVTSTQQQLRRVSPAAWHQVLYGLKQTAVDKVVAEEGPEYIDQRTKTGIPRGAGSVYLATDGAIPFANSLSSLQPYVLQSDSYLRLLGVRPHWDPFSEKYVLMMNGEECVNKGQAVVTLLLVSKESSSALQSQKLNKKELLRVWQDREITGCRCSYNGVSKEFQVDCLGEPRHSPMTYGQTSQQPATQIVPPLPIPQQIPVHHVAAPALAPGHASLGSEVILQEAPVVQQSIVQQSIIQPSVIQQSEIQKSAIQQSAIQQSAVQQSAIQQSAVQQSAIQQSLVQRSAMPHAPVIGVAKADVDVPSIDSSDDSRSASSGSNALVSLSDADVVSITSDGGPDVKPLDVINDQKQTVRNVGNNNVATFAAANVAAYTHSGANVAATNVAASYATAAAANMPTVAADMPTVAASMPTVAASMPTVGVSGAYAATGAVVGSERILNSPAQPVAVNQYKLRRPSSVRFERSPY